MGQYSASRAKVTGQAPLVDLTDLAAPDDFSEYVQAKREEAHRLYPPLTPA